MSEDNFNRNIYFNTKNEESAKAWEILHSEEVKQNFKSQNKFIIMAIIDYYERKIALKEDSYLETREKEDEFIDRLVNGVEKKVMSNIPALIGASVLSGQYPIMNINANQATGGNTIEDEPEENDLLDLEFGR